MAAYTYKCRECGEYFDEPHRWVEMHGFTYGPGEHWSACPYCDSCDYDEAYIVEREEEALEEDEDFEEEEEDDAPEGEVAQSERPNPLINIPSKGVSTQV